MDDLLALFDDNPPEEPVQPSTSLDDSDDDGGQTTTTTTSNQQQQKKNSSNHVSCTAVDARVDIRMKNRKISSIDLLDMISGISCPYHSPASLAAMSMVQLNQLLMEPVTGIVDTTTVQGKANIMTIGIVFSNSSTRIATTSGNAFCILTIGTLRTGPAVSLLLFGGAYGQHVKQCKPGMVIAVVSPKLVPSKQQQEKGGRDNNSKWGNNGDTAITFTLNDARQIVILGESEDYGVCQGRVRGKNDAGIWISNAKPCRTVVDKRVCLYCPLHRGCQQQNKNNHSVQSGVAPNTKGAVVGTVKMQALRLESTNTMASSMQHGLLSAERRMILPQNSLILPHHHHHPMKHLALQGNNNNPRSENMLAEFRARQSGQVGMLSSSSSLTSTLVSQNSRLLSATASNHHRQQQPVITEGGPQRSVIVGKSLLPPIQQQQTQKNNNMLLNPYSNKKQVTPDTSIASAMGGGRPIVVGAKHDARPMSAAQRGGNKIAASCKLQDLQNILHPPIKKRGVVTSSSSSKASSSSSNTKRPRTTTLNTVSLEGFNGSVVVPKPKPILFASTNSHQYHHATGRHLTSSSRAQQLQQQQEQNTAAAIRAKQQQMAERLREKQQQQQQDSTMPGGRNSRQMEKSTSRVNDSLFGTPLDDAQREQLLAAKSHFADEAKSEEYARSRKVVVELEKQEEKKNNPYGKNKNKNTANNMTVVSSQKKAMIQKQWHCKTCGKSYGPTKPRMCEQANHKIVLCREIQKQKSTSEKRLDLSNKDASDGGLKLGSGIEWSYSSRFSYEPCSVNKK